MPRTRSLKTDIIEASYGITQVHGVTGAAGDMGTSKGAGSL